MTLGETLALLVSLFSLWVAIREIRRCNVAMVRLMEFEFGATHDFQNGVGFTRLSVQFKNTGVTLHDVGVSLSFRGPHGRGWVTLPFVDDRNEKFSCGELARGMIAKFSLRSSDLDKAWQKELSETGDIGYHEFAVCIHSQGHEVASFLCARRLDSLRAWWNSIASRLNRKFDRTIHAMDGAPLIQQRNVLPAAARRDFPMESFRNSIRRKFEEAASVSVESRPTGVFQSDGH